MNRISACIFPDTRPDAAIFLPFVQVFHQVVYCQPVEAVAGTVVSHSPVIDKYLSAKRLVLHPPAPLGKDRERFQALLNDLQNRRDDYASQLVSLSLAGNLPGRYGESKQSIISRLLKSGSIATTESEEQTMLLWQARLLLKLGEYFDTEQEALDAALQTVTSREGDLLTELRMESDSPFSLTDSLRSSGGEGGRQLEHRLTAWSRLFCLGESAELDPMVYITPHIDAFERILDVCEEQKNCRTEGAFNIPLPVPAEPIVHLGSTNDQTAAAPFLSLLSAITEEKETDSSLEEWQQYSNKVTADAFYARRTLRLVSIHGRSPVQLFNESFASLAPSLIKQDGQRGDTVLIGLLEPA